MSRVNPRWILAAILWLLSLGSAFIFTLTLVKVNLAGAVGQTEILMFVFTAIAAVGFMIAGVLVAFSGSNEG
jgi:hypothetical protein